MNAVTANLVRSFDFVIFDLPPINAVSDGLVVANLIQGMLVVVRQDYSNRQDLSATLRQLEYLHIKVLGFVMTCATASGRPLWPICALQPLQIRLWLRRGGTSGSRSLPQIR